ncbi:hypothetical protein ACJMK2_043982 [Sinanodonta woodiana]|uniref:Zinc-ribbon domain-containing protein n=2 Tax=Sinanodonta woodiana TaxID=1069815 RepID=A0ABD3VZ49_SINWO
MFCINCAEKLYDGAKFCHQCGTAVPGKAASVSVCKGGTLSEEGEQSLLSLKKKFEIFKEKSLKKRSLVHKGSKEPESLSHNLGVQILDRNYKAVKRVFQGPSGFTGIIHISVDGASTSKTWKEVVQAKFKNCKLTVCRYEEGVCHKCVNEDEYTISNLLEEKRKKHLKELRCYMMVEGKGIRFKSASWGKNPTHQPRFRFIFIKSLKYLFPFAALTTLINLLDALFRITYFVAIKYQPGLFTSCSSDVEVELLSAVTKKEEKNVQPSVLCKSSTKSAVSSATTVVCTSTDCVISSLELPTESESTQSAVPSSALVEAILQPSAMPDIESWTMGDASLFSSSLRSTSDAAVSSMENELPHMKFGHRKRQKPLMKMVDRKKMRYDAAKEYIPEVGATDQTRNFVIINGSTNEAMEGQINVAESIKALYSWIAGTIIPENLPAQFELVCMLTFHDMECTDFGCEHSYPLETEAGKTPSVTLLPEVLVIKKIGDELDETLTGFDDVYFSV